MAFSEDELTRLLHSTEHTFVERKTSGDQKDWVKTVVAFANTLQPSEKGVLFIGARDNGEIEHSSVNLDSLQKKFSEKMQNAYPPIYYTTKIVSNNERECLAVIVPGSAAGPHFAGPLYLRDGSKSVIADPSKFETLLAARLGKARELQKWQGKQTTLQIAQRLPGVGFNVQRTTHQATVESCNQFYVTVFFENRRSSFPLASLEISYDHSRSCLKLLVSQ